MVLALWFLRRMTFIGLECIRGIASSVLRHWGRATRRWNSSLRSHRTWRSQCRHVLAGLNKTLFAPVGPNSRCRGHQRLRFSLEENDSLLGRMNASRGHQRGGASSRARDAAKIPPNVHGLLSSGLSDLLLPAEAYSVS